MAASWTVTEGSTRKFGRSLTAWAVTMFSTLSGDFVDDTYYQTWFSFPSVNETGVYETFTCTQ